jgi:ubiquinone/menaquinone biosynthesis C-methylase UbiE
LRIEGEMKMPPVKIHWTPDLYNKIARYYDWMAWLFPIQIKGHRMVLEGIGEGSLIDVACGTGTLLGMALKTGLSCYGMDTSIGMLTRARGKASEAKFEIASFYDIPFPDDTFDYVVETNAVSGVEIEVDRVIREMVRVCKPGGELRLADYAKPPTRTGVSRTVERVLHLVGDSAYDYVEQFRVLGYDPEIQVIGWGGMYQFIRVVK